MLMQTPIYGLPIPVANLKNAEILFFSELYEKDTFLHLKSEAYKIEKNVHAIDFDRMKVKIAAALQK